MESCNRYHSDHDTYLDAVTIIYWLFIEQQIETRSHRVLVMMGMIYGGMYLHHVLIKRYTCWWKVLTEKKKKTKLNNLCRLS